MAKTKKPEKKKTAHATSKAHAAAKKTESRKSTSASAPLDPVVTVDRRAGQDRRKGEDRRKVNIPVAVERRKLERREKVSRRRQIDPTTCERDYTPEEVEFMTALADYKRASGRMFPTCSEILEVVRKLGYEKRQSASLSEATPPVSECAPLPPAMTVA